MRHLLVIFAVALIGCSGEASWAVGDDAPGDAPSGGGDGTTPVKLSSFQGLNDGLPASAAPLGLAQLDGRLYLATADTLFGLASGERTWAPEPLSLRAGEQLTSVVRIDLQVFAATTKGLWVHAFSDDGFTLLASAPAGAFGLGKRGSELFLATGTGFFVSTDQGRTWKSRATGAPFTAAQGQFVAAAAQTRLFVVDAEHHVWSSDDSGATWEQGVIPGTVRSLSAGGAVVLATTQSGALRSDNYGNTFHPVSVDWSPLSIAVSQTRAFAGTMNGVRVSDDAGATWRDSSAGLPASAQVPLLLTAGNALLAQVGGAVWLASVE